MRASFFRTLLHESDSSLVYTRQELALRIGYLFVSAALAGAFGVSLACIRPFLVITRFTGASSIRYWAPGWPLRHERVRANLL